MVGRSGASGERCALVIASALSLPDFTIGIVPGTLKFDETVLLPDGTTPHSSGKISSTEVTFGGYVNVIATFHVIKNGDIYLGAQYLPLGDVSFGGNGRNADLKLVGQINFMAGINWPF